MQVELTELVDRMIGTYTSHGDSGIDHKAMENLKEVEQLLYHILEKLVSNAKQKNSYEGSVADVGKKSYDILMECKEYATEIEEPKEQYPHNSLVNKLEDKWEDEMSSCRYGF